MVTHLFYRYMGCSHTGQTSSDLSIQSQMSAQGGPWLMSYSTIFLQYFKYIIAQSRISISLNIIFKTVPLSSGITLYFITGIPEDIIIFNPQLWAR